MEKILIIKFAALGDVLRTTPVLSALKKRYPACHISWLTEAFSAEVLENNSLIDKLYIFNKDTLKELEDKNFDILINLDKDKEALLAAEAIKAVVKKGFGQDKDGSLRPFDKDSDYAYRLGIDDELKFRKNNKTYQQVSFEQVGLNYNGEEYIFNLDKEDEDFARQKLSKLGLRTHTAKIGIVTGRGAGFCGKSLPEGYYIEIIDSLNKFGDVDVLLLGGPREEDINKRILRRISSKVIDTGCDNSIGQYAGIINLCDLVITGDTLTLHLAIALKKQVVVFFGSTARHEIELYDRGMKILPDIECSPCYKQDCPRAEECMKQITPDRIVTAVKQLLKGVA